MSRWVYHTVDLPHGTQKGFIVIEQFGAGNFGVYWAQSLEQGAYKYSHTASWSRQDALQIASVLRRKGPPWPLSATEWRKTKATESEAVKTKDRADCIAEAKRVRDDARAEMLKVGGAPRLLRPLIRRVLKLCLKIAAWGERMARS